MPDVAAPYFSGNDLTAMPGNAALGYGNGVNYNFNPEVQNPLVGIQQSLQAEQEKAFQREKIQQQQKYDTLSKMMDYDHQDKVLKYQQGIKDRDTLMQLFLGNNMSSHLLKGPNGEDMSIPFTDAHQKEINDFADENTRKFMASPTASLANTADLQKYATEFRHKVAVASTTAVMLKQIDAKIAQTEDPTELSRLKETRKQIESTPLDGTAVPPVHLDGPVVKPIISDDYLQKKYRDGKNLESFNDGEGYANADYDRILSTTDAADIRQAWINANEFRNSPLPEAHDPNSFLAWQKEVNNIREDRGQKPIQLGKVTPDGKVVLDFGINGLDPRKVAYAKELLATGRLKEADESEELKNKLTRANIKNTDADTERKLHPERFAKTDKTTPAEIKDESIRRGGQEAYKQVSTVFNPAFYKEEANAPIAGKFKNVDGIDFKTVLKDKNLNPDQWKVYQTPPELDATNMVGVERVNEDDKGKETRTGETRRPDKTYIIKNINSGDLKLVSMEKGDKGDYRLLSMVTPEEAVANIAKHNHQYKAESGELATQITYNQWLYGKGGSEDGGAQSPASPKATKAPMKTKSINGQTFQQIDGKWYKVN